MTRDLQVCYRLTTFTAKTRGPHTGKPVTTATNQMDFHNSSLDRYEAQLDQQIEVNNGVTLCVTAYEKDGTERWTACCLDADEFQEAMIEVLRDGLKYELTMTPN